FAATAVGQSILGQPPRNTLTAKNGNFVPKASAESKEYTCDICNKVIKRLDNYQRHLLTHGGVEPSFSCPFCKRKFIRLDHFTSHQKFRHGIKPYQCPTCGEDFWYKKYFNNHMKANNCLPDNSSSVESGTEPLSDGRVAIRTTHTLTMGSNFATKVSCITTPTTSTTVTMQQHPGAIVTTVKREQSATAATNVNPGLKDPEVDPMWPQFDEENNDSSTTSIFYTGHTGTDGIGFDPENNFPDKPYIPGIPGISD
ncbi:C2H2-type zinc finger protein, partial [Candidatus Sororendozoicomonas aggregata]|uniref:C2H2-type zinc finger protein n=1 Tax=Candidatus Sororendozoicomonas aggregata TaxID=3073239 RepID=UPI002ED2FB66